MGINVQSKASRNQLNYHTEPKRLGMQKKTVSGQSPSLRCVSPGEERSYGGKDLWKR